MFDRPRIKKLKTPSKDNLDHYFVASDFHTEALSVSTWEILKKHAKLTPKKYRKLIINGDFLDCEHLMGKSTAYKKWAKSIPTIEEKIALTEIESEWGNILLDDAQKIFSEVVYILGNHEYRYQAWNNYCPSEYRHNFDIKTMLKLKERNIETVNYPDYLDVGNITITHGFKHGRNHNKLHMDIIQRSCLYGHVHHFNCTSYDVRGDSKRAISLPCMSDLGPEYQRKRGENNWSNGYAHLIMRSSGIFNLYIMEPWENKLMLPDGKILNG